MSNNILTIYVLTHCESCYNKRGIFCGRINSKLSADGHKNADKLAEELKYKNIDTAFVSPLIRTKETLQHILKYHPKIKVIIDVRLIERDYGKLSRKNKKKYSREHLNLFSLYHRSYDVAPPGGESMKQVEMRIIAFINDTVAFMKKHNTNILIVTHSNSIRPIRKYFEHLNNDQMMKLENIRHKIFTYHIKNGGESV